MERFWTNWMVAVAIGIILFGLAYAVDGAGALFAPINESTNTVFFGAAIVDESIHRYQVFTAGLLGAATAGWGVYMLCVTLYGFARRERWAWLCIALGVDLWFVVDTAIALSFGANAYVAFNFGMLALVAVPLIATWRTVFGRRPAAIA